MDGSSPTVASHDNSYIQLPPGSPNKHTLLLSLLGWPFFSFFQFSLLKCIVYLFHCEKSESSLPSISLGSLLCSKSVKHLSILMGFSFYYALIALMAQSYGVLLRPLAASLSQVSSGVTPRSTGLLEARRPSNVVRGQ